MCVWQINGHPARTHSLKMCMAQEEEDARRKISMHSRDDLRRILRFSLFVRSYLTISMTNTYAAMIWMEYFNYFGFFASYQSPSHPIFTISLRNLREAAVAALRVGHASAYCTRSRVTHEWNVIYLFICSISRFWWAINRSTLRTFVLIKMMSFRFRHPAHSTFTEFGQEFSHREFSGSFISTTWNGHRDQTTIGAATDLLSIER